MTFQDPAYHRAMGAGQIFTRRWNDPVESTDGTRILVCRYRPRGVTKAEETWHEWMPHLGPSVALHAAAYGKRGLAIGWETYRGAYLKEMVEQSKAIEALALRVLAGENLTLLCSSQCSRESRCHRSLLQSLIADRLRQASRAQ